MNKEFNSFMKAIYELTYHGKRSVILDKIERNFNGSIARNENIAEEQGYMQIEDHSNFKRRRIKLSSKGITYLLDNDIINWE